MEYSLGQSVNLTPLRKTIATRLRASTDTAVQANHRVRANMARVLAARSACKLAGGSITVGHMLLHCAVAAVRAHPLVNSTWGEGKIEICEDVNLGVAVATEWGLMVPVVREAQHMSAAQLSQEVVRLATRARQRKLAPEEMAGGTFTVSNLGMMGIESFTAVINPPEAAILAVGAVVDTVVPAGGGGFAVQSLCELSLTYDHRILDGEPAARFLMDVKANMEAFKL